MADFNKLIPELPDWNDGEGRLKLDFPGREFVVQFTEPEDKDDLVEYILTFYQK